MTPEVAERVQFHLACGESPRGAVNHFMEQLYGVLNGEDQDVLHALLDLLELPGGAEWWYFDGDDEPRGGCADDAIESLIDSCWPTRAENNWKEPTAADIRAALPETATVEGATVKIVERVTVNIKDWLRENEPAAHAMAWPDEEE